LVRADNVWCCGEGIRRGRWRCCCCARHGGQSVLWEVVVEAVVS
jgi:hypothetical protein